MTDFQEDALYHFLTTHQEPFLLKDAVAYVRLKSAEGAAGLSTEIAGLIAKNRLAFELGVNKWITRSGYFTGARFVVTPTREEIVNGILILGHRFVPFSNPAALQKEYQCFWGGKKIPFSDTEAAPEDLYPYYAIYGEEFAPQFIARENPENEKAYNADHYEDPPEVSIKTLDMRGIYRETAFVPNDQILVRLVNWQESIFEMERIPAGSWSGEDLQKWTESAEEGFRRAFERMGPDCSMEEQVAWAYFYGGEKMLTVPAYALETFLFDKTSRIECVPFGLETRFWFAGKEIPDYKKINGIQTQSDQTPVEKMLFRNGIPISEYVIQAYVRGALFQNEDEIELLLERIVPASIQMRGWHYEIIEEYVQEVLKELEAEYSPFHDKVAGPLRQSALELHTAIIDFAARLEKGDVEMSWLPKHSFVILSQIQNHLAILLEELVNDDDVQEGEIHVIQSSLENMMDTYEEIKEMIRKSLDNYRRSNITLIKNNPVSEIKWRVIQISIGGTNVWRRLIVPESIKLLEIHHLIRALFDWKGDDPFRFLVEEKPVKHLLKNTDKSIQTHFLLSDIIGRGFFEMSYEYSSRWTIKIVILTEHEPLKNETIRCLAGENAAPPETVEGPLRFRRFISALNSQNQEERAFARASLGAGFVAARFEVGQCNRQIAPVANKFIQQA